MAALTNAVLISNGFALADNLHSKTIGVGEAAFVVSFDAHFHMITDDNAYPVVSTIEAANARFVALSIAVVLV